MKASDLLVKCLEREGVERVYGLPGEEMEDLLFSMRDSNVTFIPVRHEQGAAFMADVHGRLTGEAGVCLSTLGPGATNLLTGVADAHLDKSPLVAITAQGGLERLHQESHQALDVVDMFEPVTKWNKQLSDPDIIHESVRKAFKVAEFEKPGATHLELPEDVAGRSAGSSPMPGRDRVRRGRPDDKRLQQVREACTRADRPLFITGNGAVRTGAWEPLRELCSCTGIPVASTYMGKGAVSDRSPYSLMTLDSGRSSEAAEAIRMADLVVAVGYDIAEHDPSGWHCDPDVPIIHIDSEPAEVYEDYNPDVEVIVDIETTVRELADWCRETGQSYDTDWYRSLREEIVADTERPPSGEPPFTVRQVLPMLRDAMWDGDVLISDVGSHKMAIARNFRTHEPNTCIISNGLASMGIAVPGAVAADLAVDAGVVAATGDGGFLMNAAELETAARAGCEFTTIVFRDDDYGLISEKQKDHTGESFGTGLSNPDLVAFAESFGIRGMRPSSPGELREALSTITDPQLTLIEIPVE